MAKRIVSGYIILALILLFILASSVIIQYRLTGRITLTNQLSAIYNLDESTGNTAADSSGNANTGTIFGAIRTTNCISGNCLSFDGINDYIQASDSATNSPASQVTVEGWFYYNQRGSNSGLIWKNSYNYILYTGEEGKVKFIAYASDGTKSIASFSESILKIPGWNHIAGTYDGIYARIYLNGILMNSGNKTPGNLKDSSGNLFIGKRGDNLGAIYFNGSIDNVRIWSKALTPTEIRDEITCPDGTLLGSCSGTKLCQSGSLIDKCSQCSCPSGQTCQDEKCTSNFTKLTCLDEYKTQFMKICPSCKERYTRVKCESRGFFSRKYRAVCQNFYETECLEKPSCGNFSIKKIIFC